MSLRLSGTVDPGDGLVVVFNPIRDKSPERAADRLFSQLRRGRCDQVLSFVAIERRNDLCRREQALRLVTWTLRDREKVGETTTLHDSVYRFPLAALPGNAWVTLRRVGNGWQPVEYECWY